MQSYVRVPIPHRPHESADIIPLSNEEPFTLESFSSLARTHARAGKTLILARVVTEDGRRFYYSAHQLNKVIFRRKGEEGAYLFRLYALNPLTNTEICGDVEYFAVEVDEGVRATGNDGAIPTDPGATNVPATSSRRTSIPHLPHLMRAALGPTRDALRVAEMSGPVGFADASNWESRLAGAGVAGPHSESEVRIEFSEEPEEDKKIWLALQRVGTTGHAATGSAANSMRTGVNANERERRLRAQMKERRERLKRESQDKGNRGVQGAFESGAGEERVRGLCRDVDDDDPEELTSIFDIHASLSISSLSNSVSPSKEELSQKLAGSTCQSRYASTPGSLFTGRTTADNSCKIDPNVAPNEVAAGDATAQQIALPYPGAALAKRPRVFFSIPDGLHHVGGGAARRGSAAAALGTGEKYVALNQTFKLTIRQKSLDYGSSKPPGKGRVEEADALLRGSGITAAPLSGTGAPGAIGSRIMSTKSSAEKCAAPPDPPLQKSRRSRSFDDSAAPQLGWFKRWARSSDRKKASNANVDQAGTTPSPASKAKNSRETFRAVFIGTDDDYLQRACVRKLFEINALDPSEALLFEIPDEVLDHEGIELADRPLPNLSSEASLATFNEVDPYDDENWDRANTYRLTRPHVVHHHPPADGPSPYGQPEPMTSSFAFVRNHPHAAAVIERWRLTAAATYMIVIGLCVGVSPPFVRLPLGLAALGFLVIMLGMSICVIGLSLGFRKEVDEEEGWDGVV
ncbi:hypothetical protein BDK51DRAFT_30964 [Blyttiomyces helicus]|uniref:Uncharacterized protein n=1 Tax=Blyttiomyces helicus TaxID=388810 RepID=A0A4P9WNU0_9FUNG|nr:hypothetical protein BDK51DRAFT_30964 [Blyttiomyces helicus]|eukprot:RKO94809.1 hypothetical protein BDK51DRAFT_30964 [Blyttiomyces helicus]